MNSQLLAVVILLLVSSASTAILYSQVTPYREEANRRVCDLQIRSMEDLVHRYARPHGIKAGDPFDVSILLKVAILPELYTCPVGGHYAYADKLPDRASEGPTFARCNHKELD